MDSLIKNLKKMKLSDKIYFGDDLTKEEEFFEKCGEKC